MQATINETPSNLTSAKRTRKDMYIFIFAVAQICLFIVGLTFCNIVHFSIEDHFGEPTQSTVFFGEEYAYSMSWMLLTSLTYIALTFVHKRLSRQEPELLLSKSRQALLNTLIIAGSCMTFFYLIHTIYSFFDGTSDEYGLLRVFVTLSVLTMGIGYAWLESRSLNFIQTSAYTLILAIVLIIANIAAVSLTIHYASPKLIRMYKRDVKKIQDVHDIATSVKQYYDNFNRLPDSLKLLDDYGLSRLLRSKVDSASYTYSILTPQSFEVCTVFESNSDVAKRLGRNYLPYFKYNFLKGQQCEHFFVARNSEGNVEIKSEFSPNIYIKIER